VSSYETPQAKPYYCHPNNKKIKKITNGKKQLRNTKPYYCHPKIFSNSSKKGKGTPQSLFAISCF